MAEETKITGIYEIKIEQGPALRAFEEVKKRLDDTKSRIRDLNKENKQLIQAENEVTAAIKAGGSASTVQAKQLEAVRSRRQAVNKELSKAVITEKGLSAQTRELSNDLSGLTENSLRFRDKMALATTEALKNSGIIEKLSAQEKELSRSLEKAALSLEHNEQQLAQLNVAYSKNEKTAEEYAQEQAILNKQIEAGRAANVLLKGELDKVSATTATLDQRIHDLNVELNAGKINTEEYRKALSRIEDETRKAGAATSTLTDRFDEFTSKQGAELKSTLSSIALNYVGVGAAIYGAQRIIGAAIDTVVEFDKALSGIRALGGEYAANIEAIGEAAKTAGIEFGFTATESLQAVEALAKAGVTTADILGGALPGALTLAAAGELSVADAAETASKAMTQFGLAGEDIPHLADLLSAAAATATGDVSDFNQALNQAGLVAAQLNIPIEEAIGTLTAFASAGLLGSDAGTSFRTMLLRLQNPTNESAKLLQQYNIKAFDLQGNFVGIENLAGQLQQRLGGLTQEQRSAALAQIFGSDAIRAANVLYTQGAEGVAKYTEQVNQSGFAQDVAAEKTNNLRGDLNKMTATYEALVLSVEDGSGDISQSFRSITQAVTEALGVILEFNKISGQRKDFTADADAFLSRVNQGRDGMSQLTFDSTAGEEFVEKYRQVITSIKDTENAEERLTRAVDNRRRALDRVKQLQEQIASNPADDSRIQLELAAAKAAVVQSQNIIDATRKETAAKQANTVATNENEAATTGSTTAKASEAKEAKNAAGSIADLTAQVQALQSQQSQSTDSAQFATYQRQIDELERSINNIKNASATPMIDEVFGKDPFSELPQGDSSVPMIDELEAQAIKDLEDMRTESRINEIQGITDFNLERSILEEEYAQGIIASREELNARLGELDEEQRALEMQSAAASAEIVKNAFQTIQDYSDANFDKKIADLDEQNSELQERLNKATTEEEKNRIKADIEQTQNQKKQLEQQKKNQQVFAVAAALIATYQSAQAAYLSQLTIPTPDAPIRAAAAAAAAVATGLLNVAKIQGLAEGGQVDSPSGRVTHSWGHAITRPNGDNVLVRTRRGHVTLKTGEIVLNEEQQRRAKEEAGEGFFGRIGVPGFSAFGGKTMARYYAELAYADGGTVGLVTPRPAPATVVQSQMVSQLSNYSERPIYTVVTEVSDMQNKVSITEQLGTL